MDEFLKTPSIVRPHAEILLSPLDWGLGHASRMIPLLNTLLHLNCRLTIAANGPQKQLIREAFPALEFLSPPDYQVRYHKNRAATIASLALALPRLSNVIRQEADWVANLLEKRSFDLLISDNRYGFCHESRPSVFITHQLRPKTPFGAAADSLLQRQLYEYINRFTECWVPDYAEAPG
ncbi:MAG TPA: glycosyl transferase family 28, partial [Flavihumibacter sp.]|nr:glycosyl transferase family 28 [Flavihumibacter sp.]